MIPDLSDIGFLFRIAEMRPGTIQRELIFGAVFEDERRMASILEVVLQEEVSPDAVIAWLQKSLVVCILFLPIPFFYEKRQLSRGSHAIERETSSCQREIGPLLATTVRFP